MARKKLSMRKTQEVIRLKYEQGLGIRQIARACGMPRSTVADYVRRAEGAGIQWPLSAEIDERKLDELLFGVPGRPAANTHSGYLVLYQGGLDYKNARTAQCDACGKKTWHKQDTPCTNGWCHGTLHVLPETIPQIVTYPGRGLDEGENFEEWDMELLRDRVRLVQDFDRLCDDVLKTFVDFCEHYEAVDEEILVPKTIKVLKAV